MSLPIGTIINYVTTPPPSGFLECGGQPISRTKYCELWRVIRDSGFGSGDGSTTFNLPDLRGRCVFGPNSMGGDTEARLTNAGVGGINGNAIGNTGGEESHKLAGNSAGGGNGAQGPGFLNGGTEIAAGAGYENIVATGESEVGHNNVPPGIVIPYIIYTGVHD